MLYPVHLGCDALFDRRQAVRVRSDAETDVVCLLDNGSQFLHGELAGEHVGAWRQHSATGHDLDDVGTAVRPVAHRLSQCSGAGGLPAHGPAVAPERGDGRPGRDYGRSVTGAPVTVHNRPLLVAEIAHGCDAYRKRSALRRLDGVFEFGGT